MKLDNTPVTSHCFEGRPFWLKRDDLLHPEFSGNKARKLAALLDYPTGQYHTLIGYGSVQANSLYSLAALAKIKSWQLEFYVDRIPDWLKQTPRGNYRAALELGATVVDLSQRADRANRHPRDYIDQIRQPDAHCLVVPEGGRCALAESGVKQLASEIIDWQQETGVKPLTVALPSGTGTTALYLHKYLHPVGIEVITCACVGGDDYLRSQWQALGETSTPIILQAPHKHHFGKLYQQDFAVWQALKAATSIEFDLLYDPLMWRCLSTWREQNQHKPLLYIHQGGLLGNETMLPRYRRKYAADISIKK